MHSATKKISLQSIIQAEKAINKELIVVTAWPERPRTRQLIKQPRIEKRTQTWLVTNQNHQPQRKLSCCSHAQMCYQLEQPPKFKFLKKNTHINLLQALRSVKTRFRLKQEKTRPQTASTPKFSFLQRKLEMSRLPNRNMTAVPKEKPVEKNTYRGWQENSFD